MATTSDAARPIAVQRALTARRSFPWLRFVGPGRLLGAAGVTLVLAGVAWWMLPRTRRPDRVPAAAGATRRAAEAGVSSCAGRGAGDDCPAPTTSVAAFVVHVTGAVRAPGVYELQPGERVADAIAAAGGALADADADALNLAAPLADGDRIAVPTRRRGLGVGRSAPGTCTPAPPPVPACQRSIDLNTADAAALETLPGIGPATAAAIVDHRDAARAVRLDRRPRGGAGHRAGEGRGDP